MIEAVGIVATVFILFSMVFKTTSVKGSIIMRVLNLIGSVVFVVYGILLPALSTAILNGGLILINGYHLIVLIKNNKKPQSQEVAKNKEA